jgi:4-hydroxybenzoyl-CoA thioesterase
LATLPFTVQRRIAWGECDPARIGYTPRTADYAVEAVEAWYETVLGVSWVELADRYDLDAPFVYIDCDYLRPLLASQIIHLQVLVTSAEQSSISFAVIGESSDGAPCFIARLVGCFVERNRVASIPIPPEFRQRIENYQEQCGEAAMMSNHDLALTARRIPEDSGSDDPGRHYLSGGTGAFVRQRRVVYGDCDASGNIYAPRIFDYAVEAIGEWYEKILGVSWMDLVYKREQGAPFVSVACEYLRPMASGQTMTTVVLVTRLGGASIGFAVVGYDAKGVSCFYTHLVACFIDQDGFKTIRIPEVFRKRIQKYQSDCETLVAEK